MLSASCNMLAFVYIYTVYVYTVSVHIIVYKDLYTLCTTTTITTTTTSSSVHTHKMYGL